MTMKNMVPAAPAPATEASPQGGNEIQTDHQIQGLEYHAGGHRRGHLQDVPGDGTLGEIFHR
jgi:hypothetical protein